MLSISTVLIVLAMILDILLAFSIPFIPAIGFPLVIVDFINISAADLFVVGNSTSFTGQLDSAGASKQVANLTELQLGLWAACYTVAQNEDSDPICFPAFVGYSVILTNLTTTVTIVELGWSYGLSVEPLGGALTLVSVFTEMYPRHSYILIGAIGLQALSMIFEIIFFVYVSKAVSGSQVKATLGLGFTSTVASLVFLLVAGFLHARKK